MTGTLWDAHALILTPWLWIMVPGWTAQTGIACLALAGIAAIIWRPHRGQSFEQWWRAFVRAQIISDERVRRLGSSDLGAKHNDRRAALRRGYNDDAWIRVGGSLLRQCRVIDLSRTGVRLKITNADRIPDTFTLILSKNSIGRPARLKWRCRTQIGAEYS